MPLKKGALRRNLNQITTFKTLLLCFFFFSNVCVWILLGFNSELGPYVSYKIPHIEEVW